MFEVTPYLTLEGIRETLVSYYRPCIIYESLIPDYSTILHAHTWGTEVIDKDTN